MTTKRPLPQSDQERIYVYDKDYRCDPWDTPDIYDQSTLTSKQQPIAAPSDENTNDNDEQLLSQPPEEDTHSSKTPIFPDKFTSHSTQLKSTEPKKTETRTYTYNRQ